MVLRNKTLEWLNKIIYWGVIIIPFAASFSSAVVEVFSWIVISIFILKKILTRNATIAKTPINIPFLLLIIISFLSFYNSVSIRASAQGILKLLKYGFLVFIIAGETKDRKHFIRIISAVFLGLLLSSLDGIYQMIFGIDFFRHKPYDSIMGLTRLKAAFPHTNIFAGYLALFVPVCLPVALYYLEGKKRIILEVIFLLGLFCLIFTFSRSAIFGVWLTLLIMGLIRKDKIVMGITILSMIVAPFIAPQSIKNWSSTTTSVWEFLLNKERFVLYETSLNMIKEHPVVGVGVNTYVLNYQKYKLHDTSVETANTGWYAHNSYLQMAGEIGLIGLAVFIWLLILLIYQGFSYYRKYKNSFFGLCSLGIVLGIVAFLINGLTETNLYYPKIAVLFWFEVGLLASIWQLNNSKCQSG